MSEIRAGRRACLWAGAAALLVLAGCASVPKPLGDGSDGAFTRVGRFAIAVAHADGKQEAVQGGFAWRDDGIRYGELLAAAGVPVTVDVAESLVHGYIAYSGVVPAATEATGRGLAALRAALHD